MIDPCILIDILSLMIVERTRGRTCSESSDGVDVKSDAGVGYDVDGKFSYSSVITSQPVGVAKTTVDENGKFSYFSSDMRPVPPGLIVLN